MQKKIMYRAKDFRNKLLMFFSTLLISCYSFSQETKKIDIDVNAKSGNDNFFAQPWVWIVGGAVFILLLVALLRGKSSNS